MQAPTHGEQTSHGIWLDETAFQEPLLDPRQGVNIPDCDVLDCTSEVMDRLTDDNPVELTYNGIDGLWLCPTHWAEFYTYEAPRLTRYGDTAELFGNRTN